MRLLLVKILFLISTISFGQGGQIVGHVTLTDNLITPCYLTILLKLDSVEVIETIPDSNGDFGITKIKQETYSLVVRQFGNRDAITDGLVIKGDTIINLNLVYPPPCTFTTDKKPRCIDGHMDKIIPTVYGLPSKKTMKRADKGKVHLAGCNLTGCDSQFWCTIHKKEL
jgi:hypothetical protein